MVVSIKEKKTKEGEKEEETRRNGEITKNATE